MSGGRTPVRQWGAAAAGTALGALAAPADLAGAAGPASLAVARADRALARLRPPVATDPLEPGRCRRYLAVRAGIGVLGAGVLVLLALCVVVAASMVSAWLLGGTWALVKDDGGRVDTGLLLLAALPGTPLLFAAIAGVPGVAALDRWWAARALGRDTDRALRARVAELTETRDHVVVAVDEERRRIERDLHDGIQQRLVALGMLIGRARRADRPGELLAQAHAATQDAITELREVAARVYPAALDHGGLPAALAALAERAPVRVEIDHSGPDRLRPPVETAVWFVVAEAVTNAAKHAGAQRVRVGVAPLPHAHVLVTVTDDGRGGADPAGPGLSGLARRVAALDGSLRVDSPAGGPTTVRASLPCG